MAHPIKIKILLLAVFGCASMYAQIGSSARGKSGPCTLTGTATTGYVLTSTGGGRCSWQAVGAASVDDSTIKNATFLTDTGTANAVSGSTSTTFPSAYTTGQCVSFVAAATNTGASTIAVSGKGVVNLTKMGATALAAGNKIRGQTYMACYDGTEFQLVNFTLVAADVPGAGASVTNVASGCGLTGGPITTSGTIKRAIAIDSQTGAAAFAIPTGDCGGLVTRNNASAVSDTISQAGSTGFPAAWYVDYTCLGAGGCTITPAVSTINGAASLTLTQKQSTRIVSDGVNYTAELGGGSSGGATLSASTISSAASGTGGGTAQAQTVTLSPAIASLTAGLTVCWTPSAANSGPAPTLSVNGLAAAAITKWGNSPLVANDLVTTQQACATYNGNTFVLGNPASMQFLPSLSTIPASAILWNHFFTNCDGSPITNTVMPDCPVLASGGIFTGGVATGTLGGTTGTPTCDVLGCGFVAANKQTIALPSGVATGLKTFVAVTDAGLITNIAASVSASVGSWDPIFSPASGTIGLEFYFHDASNGASTLSMPQTYFGMGMGPASAQSSAGYTYPLTSPEVYVWEPQTSGGDLFWYNGAPETQYYATGNSGSVNLSGVTMQYGANGSTAGGPGGALQGKILAAMAFNISLTQAQINDVMAYMTALLASKGTGLVPIGQLTAPATNTVTNKVICGLDSLTVGFGALTHNSYCQPNQSTYLTANVAAGATTATVLSATNFVPNEFVTLDYGYSNAEQIQLAGSYTAGSASLTFATPTANAHWACTSCVTSNAYLFLATGAAYQQGNVTGLFLNLDSTNGPWTIVNRGRSGTTVQGWTAALPGIMAQECGTGSVGRCIFVDWGGTNDIAGTNGQPASSPYAVVAQHEALARIVHAAGGRIVEVGMISRGGATASGGYAYLQSVGVSGVSGTCTTACTVTGGSGGTCSGVISGGLLKQVNVTAIGSGYTTVPTIVAGGGSCVSTLTPVIATVGNKACSAGAGSVVPYQSTFTSGSFGYCGFDSAATLYSQLLPLRYTFADAIVDPFQIPGMNAGGSLNPTAACMGVNCYNTDNLHLTVAGQQTIAPFIASGINRALGHWFADEKQFQTVVTAAAYTIPDYQTNTWANPTANSQTITLPQALAATTARYCVYNQQQTGTNTLTVTTQSYSGTSQTINGSGSVGASLVTVANATNTCFTSNGQNWWIY